jgi:hypothetical protein
MSRFFKKIRTHLSTCLAQFAGTIVPSKLRNDRFLGALSVTVLSITKDIFVYFVITIRCKRRVKNCKFQFDSSDS